MTDFKPGQRIRLTIEGVVDNSGHTMRSDNGGIWGFTGPDAIYEILAEPCPPCPPCGSILLDRDDNSWRVGASALHQEAGALTDVRVSEWSRWVEHYGPYSVLREGPA